MTTARAGADTPSSPIAPSAPASATPTWDVRGPGCAARVTSPAPREVWDEIIAADPLAGPTQLPEWLDCMCQADGWADSSRLYEMPGGRRLVLPLVRKTVIPTPGDAKPLSIQASFPHGWGLGGILAPGGTTMADAALVLTDVADSPGLRTTIRPDFVAAPAWGDAWSRDWAGRRRGARETAQVTHVLDLGGGIDKVWSTQMSSKARTGIRNARRQADKAGLQIEVGSSSRFVADSYDVYLRWLDSRARERRMPREIARWRGMRAQPIRRFQTAVTVFGERCRIWVARLGGIPVAARIALFHGAIAVGWRASSDRDLVRTLRVDEHLQFLAIEYACEIGCQYFYLGESGGAAGLAHFKNRLGATEYAATEYAFERLPISRLEAGFIDLRRRVERRALARNRPQCGATW